jgi:predicted anti-sigma-YlaC factor YlaD
LQISDEKRRCARARSRVKRAAGVLALAVALCGCSSMHRYATNKLGDTLAASGTGYASDDDPELIRAAAPFSLKLMESVLQETPQHAALLTATAGGFTEYAYAFVGEDGDELEARDLQASLALHHRALLLYVRARGYGMRALEARHPNFQARLRSTQGAAAAELDATDAKAIYWTGAAWAAAISLDKDSADAVADLPLVDALLMRLAVLDPDYDHGALDSLLMSWEGARIGVRDPQQQVRVHFERAVKLSGGQKAGPYVTFAEVACVRAQDRKQFTALLQQALAIDPALRPQWQLENLLMQRRARWLLTQTDQLFIE